jgi:hypothetical protein
MAYEVRTFENGSYSSEAAGYLEGTFATYEDAFDAAQAVLRKSLEHLHQPGMDPGYLCALNSMYGDDPAIFGGGPHYSSRDHCRALAEEVCHALGGWTEEWGPLAR